MFAYHFECIAVRTEVEKLEPRQIPKVKKELNNNTTCSESNISYREHGCVLMHTHPDPTAASQKYSTEHCETEIIISIIKGEIRMKHFSKRIKRQKEN